MYSVKDFSKPIATYKLGDYCRSGIITDGRLYLGGEKKLHIFEVTAYPTLPLTPVKVFDTKHLVQKILRVGQELLLGEIKGYLEVFNINKGIITNTKKFKEGGNIHDIIDIDGVHYLLAA